MNGIVFDKVKRRGGTVNRVSDYVEPAVRRGFIIKLVSKISQNLHKTHAP